MGDHKLRRLMQMARPRVVAQSRPDPQHLVQFRRCESRHVGKPGHKAFEIGNDRFHLRLLKHHLGNPDPIGRRFPLPGQIPSPVGFEPRQQTRRQLRGQHFPVHDVSPPPRSTRMTVSRTLASPTRASCTRISASMSNRPSSAIVSSSVALAFCGDFVSLPGGK